MLATNNEQPLANATMFFEVGFEVDPLKMHFNPLHNFFLQLERKSQYFAFEFIVSGPCPIFGVLLLQHKFLFERLQ